MSYEIMYGDGAQVQVASLDEARRAIARDLGRLPSEVGWDQRSSSCGTVERYEAWLAGSPEHVASICSVDEPPPGWEDRLIDRARAAGLI